MRFSPYLFLFPLFPYTFFSASSAYLRLNSSSPLLVEGNHRMTPTSDPARQLLRHTLATVAYRGGKALRGAPDHFASFHLGDKTRTPAQILAHMGDLFDWALSIAKGQQVARFFAALKKFDDYLSSTEPLHGSAEGIFQGPVADALNHIGQIAMLRRLAGSPIMGENYYNADIAVGRLGLDQSAPRREFE
ncbi:MAG: hypothetical protein AUH66_05075 [Acidobacteria bacterium 13_1_40CM_4_57_6]|nr:MAG: hypothetical protein AUH66_05075 [Acidobacteria bacterium 13_1_40CM_4_57_6]